MIVISHDVVWGIAQPLYVYAPYAMYSFICICEYCRVEGRMIYEMVVPADPSAALASSNNPKFFIHPQILRSTCRTLASSVSRSIPQHARDSPHAESSLSLSWPEHPCSLHISAELQPVRIDWRVDWELARGRDEDPGVDGAGKGRFWDPSTDVVQGLTNHAPRRFASGAAVPIARGPENTRDGTLLKNGAFFLLISFLIYRTAP
ncbi:hypothetical protein L208DRAFT_62955 [Tricholoma matsutake]|nr:hypothetical protein L208DRAFT_62955 [Tricholoma matsutake 945]